MFLCFLTAIGLICVNIWFKKNIWKPCTQVSTCVHLILNHAVKWFSISHLLLSVKSILRRIKQQNRENMDIRRPTLVKTLKDVRYFLMIFLTGRARLGQHLWWIVRLFVFLPIYEKETTSVWTFFHWVTTWFWVVNNKGKF